MGIELFIEDDFTQLGFTSTKRRHTTLTTLSSSNTSVKFPSF